MHAYFDPKTGEHAPLISDSVRDIIMKNADKLNAAIVYDRDFDYDFFGFKTLERSYLLKLDGEVCTLAAGRSAPAQLERAPTR